MIELVNECLTLYATLDIPEAEMRPYSRAGDDRSINEVKGMEKQPRNHVNRKLCEFGGAPGKPTGAVSGEFVTETFDPLAALPPSDATRATHT